MKKKKCILSFFLSIVFVFLTLDKCQSSNPKASSSLFDSCMETFNDELKCHQFLTKIDSPLSPKKKFDLTDEQKLYIRNELKDLLDTKSKSFVIEKLGEPDEKFTDGSGREFFKYTRPISRYSSRHDPDVEILIIFKRNFVTKIIHKKSETTP